jgi:hypothetical protein
MTVTFDTSVLLSYYQVKAGLTATGTSAAASSTATAKKAPTPPWQTSAQPLSATKATQALLAGRKIIDESSAKLDLPGASTDYKKLFALYQGLGSLLAMTEQAQTKNIGAQDLRMLQSAFSKGLAEVQSYVGSVDLDKVRLALGDVSDKARTDLGVPKTKTEYVTKPLFTGSSNTVAVPAFEGDVQFNVQVKAGNNTKTIAIDLSEMGGQTRSLANVVNFMNGKLQEAGVTSRFATQRIPGVPNTTQIGGKTVTLSTPPDQWALKVNVDSVETVSFAPAATAGAIYLAQSVGDPDPDNDKTTADGVTSQELLKFQTDTTNVDGPVQPDGATNWVDGRAFAQSLGPEVQTVRATKMGPDGSVYMLADVTAATDDQDIKGARDVALMKYDSAGNLVYSRTLGAADEANGLGLAVSADGQVAVAGSVKGVLSGAVNGPTNSGPTGDNADYSDSFVTLYDADGQEVWTQRRGARLDDEASQVAFADDGTVYVAGRSKSAVPGTDSIGGWDNYVEGFKTDATGKPTTLFAQSFGTTGDDRPAGLVVDGSSVVVASVEQGRGVLRRFDVSGSAPTLTATRDLGDLMGGSITGLALDGGQVVVAGSTSNGALDGGTITRAYTGGADAFAMQLSSDLAPSSGDRLAYYGGAGDDTATGLAVGDGKVWLTGSTSSDLPGMPVQGEKDGFVAGLDMSDGSVDWARRFSGKQRNAAPSAIAFQSGGASVLDRLGLPQGTLDMTDSTRLTAVSSLRAGDEFTVASNDGRPVTVTIDNKDTLDTLATKVQRALGFQVKVEIVTLDGMRKLQISPSSSRQTITIGAGKTDVDALEMLGLSPGVVRATTTKNGVTTPADGKADYFGLGLPMDINLSDTDQIKHAAAEIAAAQGVIRKAYQSLANPASATTTAKTNTATSGTVPAYLTAQIANYQAALDRLTGGNS